MFVPKFGPIFVTFMALTALNKSGLASRMTFKTAECRYNRQIFSNFTAQIINTKLLMDMVLVSTLSQGLKAHLGFEFRRYKAKPYQSVFQHDINYCALIKGAQESIYRRWFMSMLKVGNFSTSCPIGTGYYYLHGWTLDAGYIPSFFYIGDYRISGRFFYGRFKKKEDNPILECSIEAVLN